MDFYRVLFATNSVALETEVNELMSTGWMISGSLQIATLNGTVTFFQAMTAIALKVNT